LPALSVALFTYVYGQKPFIELTFTALYDGNNISLDSIYIENLSRGGDTMLFYPDTVLLLYYEEGIGNNPGDGKHGFTLSQNHPNPFRDETDINIFLTEKGNIRIHVMNLLGQQVGYYENTLCAGHHAFTFYPGRERFYVLSATTGCDTRAIKMICVGGQHGMRCSFSYQGKEEEEVGLPKPVVVASGFTFIPGDTLFFAGFTARGQDIVIEKPEIDNTYQFELLPFIPCEGIDTVFYEGKTYHTLTIGKNCWMAGNLDVGEKISAGQEQANNNIIEKYCYNNEIGNCDEYGGLYQWGEMMKYDTLPGRKGICPQGWHIPTDEEWCTTEQNLDPTIGCNGMVWRGTYGGGKLKETGTMHWLAPNTGATNSSGLTSLPGGYWYNAFYHLREKGYFWTSSILSPQCPISRTLGYNTPRIYRGTVKVSDALSVRCIINMLPTLETSQIKDITYVSARGGGIVTSEGRYPVMARGICWSTVELPTLDDPHSIDGSGPEGFESQCSGLIPIQKYYVRAYATNQAGTAYGDQTSFFTPYPPCPGIENLTFGGQVYNTVRIGSQCWLSENLNIGTQIYSGLNQTNNGQIEKYCYDNDEAKCNVYGGLYQWNEMMQYVTTTGVQGICPGGWHLPTDAEWCMLTQFIDPTVNCALMGWSGTDVGTNFKSTAGWYGGGNGTNASGFTAFPGGYRNTNGNFYGFSYYTGFWSSAEIGSNAWNRDLYYDNTQVNRNNDNKYFGFSVRCLKD